MAEGISYKDLIDKNGSLTDMLQTHGTQAAASTYDSGGILSGILAFVIAGATIRAAIMLAQYLSKGTKEMNEPTKPIQSPPANDSSEPIPATVDRSFQEKILWCLLWIFVCPTIFCFHQMLEEDREIPVQTAVMGSIFCGAIAIFIGLSILQFYRKQN